MRPARLPSAFVVAAGVHALAALALLFVRTPRRAPPPQAPVDELVFVTEEPTPPAAPTAAEPASMEVARTARGAPHPPPAAEAIDRPPPPTAVDEASQPPPAPAPATSARVARGAEAPVDLGIGGYWRSVALGPAAPALSVVEAPAPRPSALPSPDRILKDVLDAHDRDLGLGSSGPIVTAAHEAASIPDAPETGNATIELDTDATGLVVAANVISTTGDPAGWRKVSRELVRALASKRLHLPPGARGLRTRLRITAEQTLPSGEKRESHAGAVPDDVPGADPSCVGEGSERKCTAGMPVGVTGTLGDLSNIGARAIRIVRARILGETTL